MHAWAEPQHDLGDKPGSPLDRETTGELTWVAASVWGRSDLARDRAPTRHVIPEVAVDHAAGT